MIVQTPDAMRSSRLQGVCQDELANEFDVADDFVSGLRENTDG